MARFPEFRDEELDDEQRRVAAAIRGGPRGGLSGPFVPLLHSPSLADRVQSLGAYLRYACSLPNDLKELAIIVTARHCTAQFEWHAHSRFALEAGISEEIVVAVAEDRRPGGLSPVRAAVYDFCIELHEEGRVSDATFQRALDLLDRRCLMDLIGLCGYYTLIAMVLNVAQVPIPDGERCPSAAADREWQALRTYHRHRPVHRKRSSRDRLPAMRALTPHSPISRTTPAGASARWSPGANSRNRSDRLPARRCGRPA